MRISSKMPEYDEPQTDTIFAGETIADSYQEISSIQERWLSIKSHEIISELTQIQIFSESLEKLGYGARGMAEGVNTLIVRLRGDKRDSRYTRIVEIITKYLNGIHNFMSNTQIRGVLSYEALFESTIIAISREVESVDLGVAY